MQSPGYGLSPNAATIYTQREALHFLSSFLSSFLSLGR